MGFRRANRAQALQVGAILLFGFLVIGLALFQTTVVPEQNKGVEFNAYEEATGDMIDLRNDVLVAAGQDRTAGTTVRTGVSYPSRAFFVNPGPPPNRVETTDRRNVTIANVSAVDGEASNTRQFIDAIDDAGGDGQVYRTRAIRFDPNYKEFRGQPIVVTGGSAYREVDGDVVPIAGQTLIQGTRIDLVMVDGDVSEGGGEASLTTEPVSASTRTVTVTGDDDPIVLTLDPPPGVTAEEWVDSSVGESIRTQETVENVEAVDGRIRIELDPDEQYRLRMSLVEVRERDDSSLVNATDPAYVIAQDGDGQSITSGRTADVTAEVRDRFNNPVAGEPVRFEIVSGNAEFLDGTQETTVEADADGRASARLVVQDDEDDVAVEATPVDAEDLEVDTANFEIQVRSSFESGSGSGALLLSFSDADADGPDGEDPPTGARFQVRNLADEEISITGLTVEKTSFDESDDDIYVSEGNDGDGPWTYEIYVDSTDGQDGLYDAGASEDEADGISIGQRANLDGGGVESQPGEIPADSGATVYLYQFRTGPGGGNTLNTGSKFIEVTVYFETADGEEHRVTTTLFLF